MTLRHAAESTRSIVPRYAALDYATLGLAHIPEYLQ